MPCIAQGYGKKPTRCGGGRQRTLQSLQVTWLKERSSTFYDECQVTEGSEICHNHYMQLYQNPRTKAAMHEKQQDLEKAETGNEVACEVTSTSLSTRTFRSGRATRYLDENEYECYTIEKGNMEEQRTKLVETTQALQEVDNQVVCLQQGLQQVREEAARLRDVNARQKSELEIHEKALNEEISEHRETRSKLDQAVSQLDKIKKENVILQHEFSITDTRLEQTLKELDELKTRAGPLLEAERIYDTAARARRRNDQLSRTDLLDKLAALTVERDSVLRRYRDIERKCVVLRGVPQPILDASKKLTEKKIKKTENILLIAAEAISSGKLSTDQWAWDFLLSQLRFYAVKNFRGMAARNVFTDNVREFWYEFLLRFGKRAYLYLQGKGFEGAGTNGKLDPQEWDGCLVMPSSRTHHRKLASTELDTQGLSEKRTKLIAENFKKRQEAIGKRILVASINFDETDFGVQQITRDSSGRIYGAVDINEKGGAVDLKHSAVQDLEENLNDIEADKKTIESYFTTARKADILFSDDLPVYVNQFLMRMRDELCSSKAHIRDILHQARERVKKKEEQMARKEQQRKKRGDIFTRSSNNSRLALQSLKADKAKGESLLHAIAEILEQIDSVTENISGLVANLQSEDPDQDQVETFLKQKDEIITLITLAFDAYVGTELMKLQCAKKLALYCIADSQRMHTDLAVALFIDAPRDQTNRQIVQAIGSEFYKQGVQVVNISMDGASHRMATMGYERPTFITQVWRQELQQVQQLSKSHCIDAFFNESERYASFEAGKRAETYLPGFALHFALPDCVAAELSSHEPATSDFWFHFASATQPFIDADNFELLHEDLPRLIAAVQTKTYPATEYTMCGHGAGQYNVPRFFMVMAITAYIGYKMPTGKGLSGCPKGILVEWVTRFRFDRQVSEFFDKGINFYRAPYAPETAPWDHQTVLTMTIDPDHVMKRFVKHVSLCGFGEDVKSAAWKRLSDEKLDCFGAWWYERDGQNVPDAKIFFSAPVENELRHREHSSEAEFCCLTRNFFAAFNDSGITEEGRNTRINSFLAWFEPKVLPFMYRDPPSSHIPCPPFHARKQANASGDAGDGQEGDEAQEQSLPIQVLEAILIMAYGRRHRMKFLAGLESNAGYDLDVDPNFCLPLANDRFAQSMDTECEISLYKTILGKQGRGQVSKASPKEAQLALRKLFEVEHSAMAATGKLRFQAQMQTL